MYFYVIFIYFSVIFILALCTYFLSLESLQMLFYPFEVYAS